MVHGSDYVAGLWPCEDPHRDKRSEVTQTISSVIMRFRFTFTCCRQNRTRARTKTKTRLGPSKLSATLWSNTPVFRCMHVCVCVSLRALATCHYFPPPTSLDIHLCRERALCGSWIHTIHHNPVDLWDVCSSFSELDFHDNPVCGGLECVRK